MSKDIFIRKFKSDFAWSEGEHGKQHRKRTAGDCLNEALRECGHRRMTIHYDVVGQFA